ncbi:MAG: MBL fold metallo-hydrolase [bacterium]|nr:MBL fold metallo-hydrolase [bacterium]
MTGGKFGWLAALVFILLTGCGGGESDVIAVDAGVDSLGAELFQERVVGASPGCVTCHSLDEGVTLVGPSLYDLAQRAATRVPGLSAVEYVRQSIVAPEAFIAPDFSAGQMVGNWAELLSADQIDSLVEYLLGLWSQASSSLLQTAKLPTVDGRHAAASSLRHPRELEYPMDRLAELVDVRPDVGHPVCLFDDGDHKVYWVGICDRTAFRCNVYFIQDGDEAIIVDPGSRDYFESVKQYVGELVDPESVTGLILCHQDPDVAASMVDWLETNPDLKIITSPRTDVLIPHYGRSDYNLYDTSDAPLMELPSGNVLRFIEAPFLHFPGAITTYDIASQFLLSGDIFAALDLDWTLAVDDFSEHIAKMDLFHLDYMASNVAARGFVRRLDGIDIDAILPQHGSIIKKAHVPEALEYLETLQCGLDIIYADLDD